MMFPPKVSRSTIAAQSRGSVKVLVQPPKLSFDAIAGAAHLGHAIGAAAPLRGLPCGHERRVVRRGGAGLRTPAGDLRRRLGRRVGSPAGPGPADRDRSAARAGVLGPSAGDARARRPRTGSTTDGRPRHDRGDSGQHGRDRGRGVLPRVRRPAVGAQKTAPHTCKPSNESPPGGSGSGPLHHLPQEGSPAHCGALAVSLPVKSSPSPAPSCTKGCSTVLPRSSDSGRFVSWAARFRASCRWSRR